MPLTLTEVDTYTADVTVPEGGDARTAASVEGPFQALANRTLHLKGRVEDVEDEIDGLQAANAYGRYFVTGTPDGSDRFTLTQIAAHELTVGGNEVTIVTAGLYIIALTMDFVTSSEDDPSSVTAIIYADAVAMVTGYTRRFSTNENTNVQVNATVIAQFSAGQKISVKSNTAGANAGSNAMTKVLSIGRLA